MRSAAILTLGFLAIGAAASVAQPSGEDCPGEAGTSRASALASFDYLRRVMDQYHRRFGVYEDVSSPANHFHAWSKIPDERAAVTMNGSSTESPRSGATAIQAEFMDTPGPNFGGFYFLNGVLQAGDRAPRPNFGTEPAAGIDLTGATALTFWARGRDGGERITFLVAGVGRDPDTGQPVPSAPFPDSSPVVRREVTLSTRWTRYTIDLRGRDLRYLLGGFGWVAADAQNPGGAVFFLDDVDFQLGPAARRARLRQPRFLRSFTTAPHQSLPAPVGLFDLVNRNAAHTYDNTLALLAFLAEGSADGLRRARLIGDAFVYAASHDRTYADGRLRDVYAAGDLSLPPGWRPNGRRGTVPIPGFYDEERQEFFEIEQGGLSTGNQAWALIALLALHRRTGEESYREAALRLAEFVAEFRHDQGRYRGFTGGLDNPEGGSPVPRSWAATEHNIDLFAAYTALAELTGEARWADLAAHARQFVEAMWDAGRRCTLTGTIDPETRNRERGKLPSDVQSWQILALPLAGPRQAALLRCAERNHRSQDAGFSGFDFNDDRDGVWFEGTAHLAVAYTHAGRNSRAEQLRRTLRRVQCTPPFGDGEGLAAASREGLTTGFEFAFFRRRHVGATAWNLFAQLGFNPFYGQPAVRE